MANAERIVKTTCQLCHLACGMRVHVEGNRVVKVEDMPEHPISTLCPKGYAVPEFFHSPDRLKHPLLRKNGSWRRLSWDDALDVLANKLNQIKQTDGARAFAFTIGMPVLLAGSIPPAVIRRFAYTYGSPNCLSVESMCYRCRLIGYMLTLGRFRVADIRNSRCIILWGHNPVNSSPVFAKWAREAKQDGARLIVIDPRTTPLAKEADLHVTIRPGTDGALLLGLMNVIIAEGLHDRDFVSEWTVGFDELADGVKAYTPECVEKITQIPADTVRSVARMYATIKPACIAQGTNALDQQATGLQNARSVAILQSITGNIDVPGGFIRGQRLRENAIEMPVRPKDKAIGQEEFSTFFGIFHHEFGEGQAMRLPDAILTGEPYPVKGLFVAGSNPLLTWPNSRKVAEAFGKLDFLAVMDQRMSETARLADLVLPAATFLEKTELNDYYSLWGHSYVMLRKKMLEYEEAWSDLRFWLALAKKMGFQEFFPWKTEEEVLDYVLEPSGFTVQYLRDEKPEGLHYAENPYREYLTKGFPTPSGKIELYSEELIRHGQDPLPVYREAPESPVSTPELYKEYPLVLTTGARLAEFCHSQHRNLPSLRERVPEPYVEINSETAAGLNVRDGDMVAVETPRGEIRLKASVSPDIMPGVVCVAHGWNEADVNLLTSESPAESTIGYPALKALLCRVQRVA